MGINNSYLYHAHPLCVDAAKELCTIISSRQKWELEFSKGKMLGVLVIEKNNTADSHIHYINDNFSYIAAYSGTVDIESNEIFIPSIYDLNNPSDFYKKEEKIISEINQEIATNCDTKKIEKLKIERKQRSRILQLEIFRHFNFTNRNGESKNIINIFADAKRGLPPGGAGECAAPRLLQYAFLHRLKPIAIAEFWYGISPKLEARVHRQFYPSCIEKCSPILKYMLGECNDNAPLPSEKIPEILFEDKDIIILNKPAEVLSTPAKDVSLFNVETWLHETHPDIKGPMLVHRLDQSTSGLMIAAKNAAVFKTLQQGFLDHSIRKTYHAWVEGNLPSECGVINLPICPNPDDRPRQVIDYHFGKTAITRYRVLKKEPNRTLLALYPFTGRTHQLRLHCASPFGLDHPIVGDRIYNIDNQKLHQEETLQLHAVSLSFQHPVSQTPMIFNI